MLNKFAPLQRKLLHANQALYISKPLKKAIMKRFYFENLYFRKRIEKKNYWLYKEERKNIFIDAAEELNNFFKNVVSNLDISKKSY